MDDSMDDSTGDSINDSIIERLSNGVTVITATARLARELRRQFDQHQLSLGRQAWESADVLPGNAWLQRTWQSLRASAEDCPVLLNEWQLVAAWENIIRDDIRTRARSAAPLWNPYATAKIAVDAWRILHDWNIDLAECAQSGQQDHRCMARWTRQFQQLCAAATGSIHTALRTG